jgi:hypothetical protein
VDGFDAINSRYSVRNHGAGPVDEVARERVFEGARVGRRTAGTQ